MSMHIVGPWLSTTSTKKRKDKITKAKQEEFENGWRERNVRLKEMKLPKETLAQYMEWVYGRGKKEKRQTYPGEKVSKAVAEISIEEGFPKPNANNKDANSIQPNEAYITMGSINTKDLPKHTRLWVTGPCTTKQTPTYTGTKVKGIAVLHKSCLQPVFSQEEAIDIARMRR